VLTTEAFARFLVTAGLDGLRADLDAAALADSGQGPDVARALRTAIVGAPLPDATRRELAATVTLLGPGPLAVRSSAPLEDRATSTSAGIYESYINVAPDRLDEHVRRCYASLFSERSLAYARAHDVRPSALEMAVLIQPAVAATAAGVAFTGEPETGCDTNVLVESVFGLGQGIVSGEIVPDAFVLNKRTRAIIRKTLGQKTVRYVFADGGGTGSVPNEPALRARLSLTDDDVRRLFEIVQAIEARLGRPVDVEWARADDRFVILQVRPLALERAERAVVEYRLEAAAHERPLVTGQPITDRIVVGRVRHALDPSIVAAPGDVIVARHIDVDWTPRLRRAAAVVTEGGGYTSHIAIILREMGIPALFGAEHAFETLPAGATVTVACNQRPGSVWAGAQPFETRRIELRGIYRPTTKVHLVTSTLAGLDHALRMPVNGIGLVRLEFLIASAIGIHPRGILDSMAGRPLPPSVSAAIRERVGHHGSAEEFYVETLCEAVCAFASRCPDRLVNVRFADLLSDDYLSLAGGETYETEREANPMLGWRGTTRLIDPDYVDAFRLDCAAFRRAVDDKGFDNITLMLPFCRTPEDLAVAVDLVRAHGPRRVRLGMMVEVPSNIALANEFADLVDYFLIGPMDLTQLTYGADRKSKKLSRYSDATAATKEMVKFFLQKIEGRGKRVFIGGWPLFQYLAEYLPLLSNNELWLVELPDRLVELFENLRHLESKVYGGSTR
jgi:pyruvate,water dikinase